MKDTSAVEKQARLQNARFVATKWLRIKKNVIMEMSSAVVWVAKLIQALSAEMRRGYHQLVLQQYLVPIAEMGYLNPTLPNIVMMAITKVETAVIMTASLR